MPYRHWGPSRASVTVFVAVTMLGLYSAFVFEIGRSKGISEGESAAHSEAYDRQADTEIQNRCLSLAPVDMSDCIHQVVKATNEDQRAQDDLIAQMDAARWNLGTLIITGLGLVLAAVGTLLIYRTLEATRDAVKEAAAGTQAAQAGVAITEAAYKLDQRPWLSIGDPTITAIRVGPVHLGSERRGIWLHFDLTVANTGKTPAHEAHLRLIIGRKDTPHWDAEVKAIDANPPVRDGSGFSIAPGEVRTLPLIKCIPLWADETSLHTSDLVWAHFLLGYQVAGEDTRKATRVGFMLTRLTNSVTDRSAPFLIANVASDVAQADFDLPPPEALKFTRWEATMT